MSTDYELFFLSDLRRQSRCSTKKQYYFSLVVDYIFERIDSIVHSSDRSEFNVLIERIKKFVPRSILIIVLNRLRYDTIVGIKERDGQKRIYCMISFQKHPSREMIGMFDIYISPQERNRNINKHFQTMAQMIHKMCLRYKKNGYKYLQCGRNETTYRILRIFKRIAKRNYPDVEVNVETSQILF